MGIGGALKMVGRWDQVNQTVAVFREVTEP